MRAPFETRLKNCRHSLERRYGPGNLALIGFDACHDLYQTEGLKVAEIPHGLTLYRKGCRCAICRSSMAEKTRQWRAKKKVGK